ncbi:MAG: hypothetical protein KDA85_14230, partial [Planctomycetaceae bacterium]|nr:hypothetical protein [Planctomycetaceae bacterium]
MSSTTDDNDFFALPLPGPPGNRPESASSTDAVPDQTAFDPESEDVLVALPDSSADAVPTTSFRSMGVPPTVSSRPLVGETISFTGILASMTHRDAARLAEECGGRSTHSVSGATTMLVVGEEGWPLEHDGVTSQKLQQAVQQIADGRELRIVAESDWLHLIGLDERRDEIQRAYTPAMLSQLLDVPVRLIRRWARLGLVRPVRRVCRLPYFDYREVASARR